MIEARTLHRCAGVALAAAAGCHSSPASPASPASSASLASPAAPTTASPAAPTTASLATLVNASIRAAYIAGVYDGFVTVGELRSRGDFGLGAADRNDGELVALDGAYYRARGDGTVVALGDAERVPFASVTRFRPDRHLHTAGPLSRAAFEARLDDWLPGVNRMFALRVHGRFARVVAGASAAQSPPYRRFSDVYPEYHLIPRDGVVGTLVGFRMPSVFGDISKAGYHFHLLSDDRAAGGHVDDEVIEDVEVDAEELHGLEIVLPGTAEFLAADLKAAPPPRSPPPR